MTSSFSLLDAAGLVQESWDNEKVKASPLRGIEPREQKDANREPVMTSFSLCLNAASSSSRFAADSSQHQQHVQLQPTGGQKDGQNDAREGQNDPKAFCRDPDKISGRQNDAQNGQSGTPDHPNGAPDGQNDTPTGQNGAPDDQNGVPHRPSQGGFFEGVHGGTYSRRLDTAQHRWSHRIYVYIYIYI